MTVIEHDLDSPNFSKQLERKRALRQAAKAPRGNRMFTALERAQLLCDPGTFVASRPLRGDGSKGSGVVTGTGRVNGRPIVVVSHDAEISAGAIGPVMADEIVRAQRLALKHRIPIVHLNDSGGARVPDGILALDGCGQIFAHNVESQNVIPQISVILGPCAGAAAYSPALTDWTFMVRGQGHMFLTGPEVVKAATGEQTTADELGGSAMHTAVSGVAHYEADSEPEALEAVRALLGFLPANVSDRQTGGDHIDPPASAVARLASVVPPRASVVFDVREVIDGILDDSDKFELMANHARSVLTMFGRLAGRPVGLVANQPLVRGGILDAAASVKIARFVEFCGRFGIPIVTLVDVPGFLPGSIEESRGVITHGAKVLKAYAAASSARLTVILRKAYGGAYIAMGSPSIGADAAWAWPGAEIAVMGPGGAVGLLHRRELAESSEPDALRERLAADYRETVARPYVAAENGILEDIIHPDETRAALINALELWERK